MTHSKSKKQLTTETTTSGTDLPESVLVGPYNIKIKVVDNPAQHLETPPQGKLFGCLKLMDETIYLDSQLSGTVLADTVLHEIMHAIWAVGGGWAREEEEVVSMMTTILLDTLRRNKSLIEYLVK